MAPDKEMQRGVSVIICCYNSQQRLPQTLENLARQQVPVQLPWELIVVDNASTDQTGLIAKQAWLQLNNPAPMLLLSEAEPGLSNARTAGLAACRYDLIVFCDDDNWLAADYLVMARSIMDQHPDFGIVGGRAEAISNEPLPGWFYESQYVYACGALSGNSSDFTGKYFIWGAGMVIRTAIARLVLHPSYPMLLTGRKGTQLISGDDDEKCMRTWLLGYKTWYDYRLYLQHFIPGSRLKLEYRDGIIAGFAGQVNARNAYFALYRYIQIKNPGFFICRQFFNWTRFSLLGKNRQQRQAANFLYYHLQWKLWENAENKAVWNFYNGTRQVSISNSLPATVKTASLA